MSASPSRPEDPSPVLPAGLRPRRHGRTVSTPRKALLSSGKTLVRPTRPPGATTPSAGSPPRALASTIVHTLVEPGSPTARRALVAVALLVLTAAISMALQPVPAPGLQLTHRVRAVTPP